MSLEDFLKHYIHQQNRLQNFIGQTVAWLSLTLVLITATVVVLRYGFNTGTVALQESILYNHAILFMLGLAYTYCQNQHVRVDVFYSQFSKKRKAWVNLLGSLFFALPVMIFVIWGSWEYVMNSWQIHEGSTESDGIPYLYLLKTLILIMAGLMILQSLAVMAQSYLILKGKGGSDNSNRTPSMEGKV